MSATDRPWWSSHGDRLERDEDPLEVHRAARRGRRDDVPHGPDDDGEPDEPGPAGHSGREDDGSWWFSLSETLNRLSRDLPGSADDPDAPAAEHTIDACGVCPICLGIRALGSARPELVAHLAEAARQVSLAVRTVLDGPGDDGQAAAAGPRPPRPPHRAGDERLQRIDLDPS